MSAFQSRLFHFIMLAWLTYTAVFVFEITAVIFLVPLVVVAFQYKRIIFDLFLLLHALEEALNLWVWFSLVDEELYLGAIPISALHKEEMVEKLHVKAVLSVVEDFELKSPVLIGTPVKPIDWKRLDIDHLQLSTPDFFAPSFVSNFGSIHFNLRLNIPII